MKRKKSYKKANNDSAFNETTTDKAKKKHSAFKVILIILIVLSILAVGTICAGIIYVKKNFNYKYNEITSDPEELGFEEVVDDDIVNIALFGIDTRKQDSFTGRSDSIMILSVNKTDKKVKLISVLRDTLVPIEKDEKTTYNKINSAYASGGPELAIKTLNTVFGLDISEYATVNFFGMADIIDAVGGIEAEITQQELKYVNAGVRQQCSIEKLNMNDYLLSEAGHQHLNGIQAVAYSRIRYVANAEGAANDYGRTDRQRYVLQQLFNKATTMSKSQYIELIKALSPCCETSLSYKEILNLAVSVLLHSPTFEESRVPYTEYVMKAPNAGVGSVVYYDLNFASQLIHSFIYDDIKPDDYIAANGIQQNDWYRNG